MEAPLSASSKLRPPALLSCPSHEGAARRTPEPPNVPVRSPVQGPGGCPVAPPEPPPLGGSPPGIPPRRPRHHEGWRRSEWNPHPTEPRTRSRKREDRPRPDYRLYAALKDAMRQKENYELFRSPDTYDLARGLALGGQSSSSSLALAEQSGGRVFPFLDPSASLVGEAFLFFPPPAGGEAFFFSSPWWEESASDSSSDST